MNKRSFILYHDYAPQFERLSDAQCGKLIKAIFNYEITGECTKLSSAADMAFSFIKNALDENKKKYNEVCKKRSAAARKSHEQNVSANAGNCTHMDAFAADTETDTETDTDTVTETETETVTVTESERKERTGTPAHTKSAHGSFHNVFLTQSEYANLKEQYGTDMTAEAIELLSTRIARDDNSRYKNENHYATIKSWVITAVKEEQIRKADLEGKKARVPEKKPLPPGFDIDLEDIFEKMT